MQFIVAEVSKNWHGGKSPSPGTLSERFEAVIAHNLERGYRLYQFQLHRMMTSERDMNETIIAVFEQITESGEAYELNSSKP